MVLLVLMIVVLVGSMLRGLKAFTSVPCPHFCIHLPLFVQSIYVKGIDVKTFLFKYRTQTGLNKIYVTSYEN
jgi:hypothetical protein